MGDTLVPNGLLQDSLGLADGFRLWPDLLPELGGSIGLMEDPLSELIEAEAEPGFAAVSVGADFDRLGALDGGGRGMGPCHGEGYDDQERARFGGLG